MRVRIYIDGFNLFYGRLHHKDKNINEIRQKLRWLDLQKLVKRFIPADSEITSINFYTADITPLYNGDKGPARQQEYYKALRTLDNISIMKGRFSKNPSFIPAYPIELVDEEDSAKGIKKYCVLKTEEKGSDVNLAAHLVFDACRGSNSAEYFDLAVVITNDSDLLEPLKIVKNLRKKLLILCPYSDYCHDFATTFDTRKEMKKISQTDIKLSQFDTKIIDSAGYILAECPKKWQFSDI
jgi:hypothetical protein